MKANQLNESFRCALVNNIVGQVTQEVLQDTMLDLADDDPAVADELSTRIAILSTAIINRVVDIEECRISRSALAHVEDALALLQKLNAAKERKRIVAVLPLLADSCAKSPHGALKTFGMVLQQEMGRQQINHLTLDDDALHRIFSLLEDARISIVEEVSDGSQNEA